VSLAKLQIASWVYTLGYSTYVVCAGVKTWAMPWSAWWSHLAMEAGWNAALWPYYFPRLMGLW
jgi:hypothetical protein